MANLSRTCRAEPNWSPSAGGHLQGDVAGKMVPQSAGLNEEEERAIARFITGKEFPRSRQTMAGQCTAPPKPLTIASTDWNGWGQGP